MGALIIFKFYWKKKIINKKCSKASSFPEEYSVYVIGLKICLKERDFKMSWVLFMNKFYCWIQHCKQNSNFKSWKLIAFFLWGDCTLIWFFLKCSWEKVSFKKERREFNSINSGQLKKIFIIY